MNTKIFMDFYKRIISYSKKSNEGRMKIEFNNPFHHSFKLNYNEIPVHNSLNRNLVIFDVGRLFALVFVLYKVGMKMPSYVLFRRNRYENNPDFMNVDRRQFEEMMK